MYNYIVGDIHGCYKELKLVLKNGKFNPKDDVLWVTGDLINRGPDSFGVLRYLKKLGKSAKIVLGNHDLNFIMKNAFILDEMKKKVFDIDILFHWLRKQPFLRVDHKKKIIMSHAGISPQWDLKTAEFCAKELEFFLKNEKYILLSKCMNNDQENNWSGKLNQYSRICFSINALTRMRYCFLNGSLNMIYNDKIFKKNYLKPWFEFKLRIPKKYSVIFGHWSSINGIGTPCNIYGLDTGCCWGRKLTLLRWEDKKYFVQNSLIRRNVLN